MALDYDPFSEEVRANPLPIYKRLRDEAPAYYMPKYDAWALSRFQDIWDSLSNDALSTARGTTPAQLLTKDQPVQRVLNTMDPPEHTKLRSVIRKCFLPQHVRSVEPIANELAAKLLDEVADRDEFDAIGDFAARLSVTIACMAIGLPVEDGPMLTRLIQRFLTHDPAKEGITADGIAALEEINRYGEEKVKERRKAPEDGPEALNALTTFELNGERFDDAAAGESTSPCW